MIIYIYIIDSIYIYMIDCEGVSQVEAIREVLRGHCVLAVDVLWPRISTGTREESKF